MKLPKKLYYITDGVQYVLLPEHELRKDSSHLKTIFGLASILDIRLMAQYNDDFRKQIAKSYGIEHHQVRENHVVRLASIREVEAKDARFSHPMEVAEGIYDYVGTSYQEKIS
jgi:hypothetical protein